MSRAGLSDMNQINKSFLTILTLCYGNGKFFIINLYHSKTGMTIFLLSISDLDITAWVRES